MSHMANTYFIGRKKEVSIIEKYYQSPKSELVAVYGRRRVGKTFLIKETLKNRFDFEFTGMNETPAKIQRRHFQNTINALTGKDSKVPADWYEAFDHLKDFLLSLSKEKVVVFLDELPWMDTVNSNFISALSEFWNTWESSKSIIKLYVCGSATTWMVDKLIGDHGGLYGRVSRPLYLAPFSLYETEQYLNVVKKMNYSRMQILDAYMIFGGIPYYLDMLDKDLPLSVNIDELFFANDAPLRPEYAFLFRSLFRQSEKYRKVVELVATKLSGLTREEISKGCNLDGKDLTTILNNLNYCDFIRVYSYPQKKEKDKIYQLTDMFTLFYLRFVHTNPGADKNFWSYSIQTGEVNAWMGYAFEQACLHHIDQIKHKLGISGVLCNVYAWHSKPFTDADGNSWSGGQIDLIIDRADNVMNLCEIKYSHGEYTITKDYAERIQERINLFKIQLKTRKALRCTFITAQGVKSNKYNYIVDNEIIADDLFSTATLYHYFGLLRDYGRKSCQEIPL